MLDSPLEASGNPDVDELIGILWDVIKEVRGRVARDVLWRYELIHTNTYPRIGHVRVTSIRGTAYALGL